MTGTQVAIASLLATLALGILTVIGFALNALRASLESGFAAVNKRFDDADKRIDQRFDDLDKRIESLDKRVDQRFTDLGKQVDRLERDFREAFGFRLRPSAAPEKQDT